MSPLVCFKLYSRIVRELLMLTLWQWLEDLSSLLTHKIGKLFCDRRVVQMQVT